MRPDLSGQGTRRFSHDHDDLTAALGPLVSRKLKSREYTEKPPTTRLVGGRVYTWGQGKYVVLRYEASFANRASASETVTMMADSDGAWRASGYTVP